MTGIYTAPVYKLEEFNNIFIELTAKNCNQRCKSCYIDFSSIKGFHKTIKDFISIDRIKEALSDTKNENIHCIYLGGAEPMTHPDFNTILRLCLKRCNVCICTNGSFLNEKKIRFLKRVEDEGVNQIFFKLSLTHFDELESELPNSELSKIFQKYDKDDLQIHLNEDGQTVEIVDKINNNIVATLNIERLSDIIKHLKIPTSMLVNRKI